MTDQAPQQQEDPINAVPINLQLPVSIVNQILFVLAKLPYEQTAGTIAAIRQQGDPQVDAARKALAMAPPSPPPANANRRARRKAAKKR